MQSLGIEEPPKSTPTVDTSNLSSSHQEGRVLLYIFVASLGFVSTGFHLSNSNSSSVFLWLGCSYATDFYNFKTRYDIYYILAAFFTGFLLTINKIKFKFDLALLIIADILMVFGSMTTFTIFSESYDSILNGRIIAGVASGINITITLSFLREVQFYLSHSEFKPERRRFFLDIFFALGIFVGFLPSLTLDKIKQYSEYSPGDYEDIDYGRPDVPTCWTLCALPIAMSVVRTLFLLVLGNVTPPDYSPAFTDEGLTSIYEEEEATVGGLYMFKFKESRSLMKLLQEPYRIRLGFCSLLTFTQMWSGIVIFIVNPLYLAMTMKNYYWEQATPNEVQITIAQFGGIYLGANVVCSVLLVCKKLPRKAFMYSGLWLGAFTALISSIMIITGLTMYLRELTYVFCFGISVGIGPAMELFNDEILPAKGMQFLASFKWLILFLFTLASGFTLRYLQTYIIQSLSLFSMCGLVFYIVFDLLPETYNVDPKDIGNLFEYVEEIDDPEVPHHDATVPISPQ